MNECESESEEKTEQKLRSRSVSHSVFVQEMIVLSNQIENVFLS